MSTTTSMFIPRMNADITQEFITSEFERQEIGKVTKVDFIPKHRELPNGMVEDYFMAFIHLDWYFNVAAQNIKNKLDDGQQTRIVYNDPQYWVVMKNKNPQASVSTSETGDVAERLECALDMIKDLQARVHALENDNFTIPPPPPPLIRHTTQGFFPMSPPQEPVPQWYFSNGVPTTPPPPPPQMVPPGLEPPSFPQRMTNLSSVMRADLFNQ